MAIEVNKPDRTPQIVPPSRLASSVGFSASIGETRQNFSILRDFASIRDNITNILFFRKGDYPDDPDFGVGIQDYLFDQKDEVLQTALEQEIRRQIRTYEPRANIGVLRAYEPDWIENGFIIDLVLVIAGVEFRGVGVSTDSTFTIYEKAAA